MRYADFYECDICNGNSVGVSLFVQGCPFHCKGCFNQQTWDFNGGKEWTEETEERFLKLVGRDYIKRVSFLGGEPLAEQNVTTIYHLIQRIRKLYPNKQVWVYTGFKFEDIILSVEYSNSEQTLSRYNLLSNIDVLIDGQFEYDKRDLTLAFRGSANQRIIDIKNTMKKFDENEEIILWNND